MSVPITPAVGLYGLLPSGYDRRAATSMALEGGGGKILSNLESMLQLVGRDTAGGGGRETGSDTSNSHG